MSTRYHGAQQQQAERINSLVVILDLNPYEWGERSRKQEGKISLTNFLNHLFVFINAHLISKHTHKLCVIGSALQQSRYLFPNSHLWAAEMLERESLSSKDKKRKSPNGEDIGLNAKFVENLFSKEYSPQQVQETVLKQIQLLLPREDEVVMEGDVKTKKHSDTANYVSQGRGSSLAASLSLALCFLNRLNYEKPLSTVIESRVIVFQVSKDVQQQYISVHNSIFCAQKLNITIDACVLNATDSAFLQQAAHITNGVYMKPSYQEGLLQYLLSVFMADRPLRSVIQLPVQQTIDFKASCFKTREQIDMGYVCSVCLSVFKEKPLLCPTCKMRQKQPTLKRPGTK